YSSASTIRAPISRPIPASVPEYMIQATEKGMMGENLVCAGDWPLPNDIQSWPLRNDSHVSPEHVNESEPATLVLTRAKKACGYKVEGDARRRHWHGVAWRHMR